MKARPSLQSYRDYRAEEQLRSDVAVAAQMRLCGMLGLGSLQSANVELKLLAL